MAKKYDSRFLIIEGKGSEFIADGMGGGNVEDKGVISEGAFAGFSLISVTGSELICDSCNEFIKNEDTAYYVAVLNRLMCKQCFEEWHREAEYYPEDADIERRNFDYYSDMLR